MSEPLTSGNSLSYWERPFNQRWKHWARADVKIWLPYRGRLVLVWDGTKEGWQEELVNPTIGADTSRVGPLLPFTFQR